jgi:hypothetical protein
MSDTIELVERVRRRLSDSDQCQIVGPAADAQIDAAEEALGVTFPPSYRTFLRTFGAIAIPEHLGVVHDFVGMSPADDVVGRTLKAREERKLADHLVVVGIGAGQREWFCLDFSREGSDDEVPVVMYDARDNALDQQFYDDFGQMLEQVMGFVADSLDQPLD